MVSLVEVARSIGFQVDVLVSGSPTSVSLMQSAGAGVVDIDVIRRPVRPLWDLIGLIKLTRFLAKADYSVVQTHTSKAGFVGRLAARLARVPVIIHTVHGFAFHDFSSSVARFLYVGLERLAAHWCDRIVTVSEHHRDVALKSRIGSPDTVLAIPNGISADRVKSQRPPKETREAWVSKRTTSCCCQPVAWRTRKV